MTTDKIEMECENCNKDWHLFGSFCWWGVLIVLFVIVIFITLIAGVYL